MKAKNRNNGFLFSFYRYLLRPESAIAIAVFMILIGVFISIVFILRLRADYSVLQLGVVDLPATGQTGDFFGGVIGSLWALAGVLLLLATLVFQKRESSSNRELLLKQLFENTYLQLLHRLREIVRTCESEFTSHFDHKGDLIQPVKELRSGISLFREMRNELHGLVTLWIRANNRSLKNSQEENLLEYYNLKVRSAILFDSMDLDSQKKIIELCYQSFYNRYDDVLGHYFRFMYNIVKFLDRTRLQEFKKSNLITKSSCAIDDEYKVYIGFLQAEMSFAELYLLFFNGLLFPKAHELIDHYKIVENIRIEDLPYEEMAAYYPNIKFKRRDTMLAAGDIKPNEER